MKQLFYLSQLNIFGVISILTAMFFLVFGTVIFVQNTSKRLRLAILYLFASFCIWCFGHGCLLLSKTKPFVYAFNAVSAFGYSTSFSSIITFFICLQKNKFSGKDRAILIVNNVLAVYVLIAILFLGNYPENYVMTDFGWRDCPRTSSIHYKLYLGIEGLWILESLVLVIRYKMYTAKKNDKILIKQANIIFWTGTVSMIIGVTFNDIFPLVNIEVPALGTVIIAIWMFGLGVAISKYKFLVPTLEYAAAEIFRIGGEMMIVTDIGFSILEVNDSCCKTLEYSQDEIQKLNLRKLFGNKKLSVPISQNISENTFETKIYTKSGKVIYVNVKSSPIYHSSIIIGVLFVLADVTAFKNQNVELEKKIKERTGQIVKQLSIMKAYTRPSLVKVIQDGGDPTQFKPKAENNAILFTDIRDFTNISSRLTSEETIEFLNSYFTDMCISITNCNGEIDKLIGDCIMALFVTSDNAVTSAIDIRKRLRLFNDKRNKHGKQTIDNGIGINYGLVNVGNIGSDKKLDYTVIGEVVNEANRLESLTKYYRTPIIISEKVKEELRGNYCIRFLDKVIVKGGAKPLKLYEIYDYADDTIKENRLQYQELMEQAYNEYEEGNFQAAGAIYTSLSGNSSENSTPTDPLIGIYRDRCLILQNEKEKGLLENWDGIFRFDVK